MTTNISWTDETWNPTTGCHKVSEGCRNCYASKLAPRLAAMGQKGYTNLPWTKPNNKQNVHLHEDRLRKPLRWRKPRRVFVNSMSDLFHELVPFEFIDSVFAVMALCPQHTFQVLTKRPERMREYLAGVGVRERIERRIEDIGLRLGRGHAEVRHSVRSRVKACRPLITTWPPSNVGLGTSVENQKAADERVWSLLRVPAAVRFLSCEPLLGPVDLTNVPLYKHSAVIPTGNCLVPDFDGEHYVSWVIAGGESGPGYREMDLDWARSLRDQCVAAGVPFFFKQSSGLRPETNALLDGVAWRQMPDTTS